MSKKHMGGVFDQWKTAGTRQLLPLEIGKAKKVLQLLPVLGHTPSGNSRHLFLLHLAVSFIHHGSQEGN